VIYRDEDGGGWYFVVALCMYFVNGCSYIFSVSGWNVPGGINFNRICWGGGGAVCGEQNTINIQAKCFVLNSSLVFHFAY
jgi:hypothetical protein